MNPSECNESCEEKRTRLYIFYGVLFLTLVVLASIHFIIFFVSRRRSKEETRDYMALKQEFVTLSLSDLRLEKEAKDIAAKESNDLKPYQNGDRSFSDSSDERDVKDTDNVEMPHPRQSSSSSSIINIRSMGIECLLPGLQRIDEESLANLSRCSTSSTVSRGRNSIRDGLHDPVIVTVATVSAIFEDESMRGDRGGSGREWEERGRRNSTMDISDIIDSPRRHFPQPQNHHEYRKSSDNTLSGHFAKRGGNNSLLKTDSHRDIFQHEPISEANA
ncbi:unnamed protein product [Orchesella dallaii]|uniref:Uncharacterized protein n=2 Tax=Orchesella dallaii TaxID=48710 RepID=A0ABP1RS15_9HEXA